MSKSVKERKILKQLRIKFALINMTFVSAILLVLFIVLGVTNYNRLKNESLEFMQKEIRMGDKDKMPGDFPMGKDKEEEKAPFSPIAVFVITVDGENNIVSINDRFLNISDEDVEKALEKAIETGEAQGEISSLNLRFLVETGINSDQKKIAFADITREKETMVNFILSSILIGIPSFIAFLLLSIFLSKWAVKPIKRSWNRQEQFVADASHELKTPVTIILANTEILKTNKKDTISNQIKWIDYIEEESHRMKNLIEDLLFLAKSEDKSSSSEHTAFSISDCVTSALLSLESIIFESGNTLTTNIKPDLFIKGNQEDIRRLIIILMDNANKYSGENGEIKVSLYKENAHVKVEVSNTSSAIDEEQQDRLFERFYRLDKSRQRETGGFGLGLSIAKRIAENHSATLKIKSDEGLVTINLTFPSD